ncbi:hypothetical protein [Micromonospora chersina]
MNGIVKHVLLYRTPQRWRISVMETPEAIGCGDLPDTPPDAPIEVAQQDLIDHLRRHWNFTGQLTWREQRPDRWIATPTTN